MGRARARGDAPASTATTCPPRYVRRARGRQRALVAGRGRGATSPTSSATSRSSTTARRRTTTRPGRLDHLDHRGHDHHRTGPLMLRAVRRNTELGLILLGTLVTVGAYVLASLGRGRHHPGQHRRRSSASCSACSSPPTSPSGASRPNADGTLLPIAGLLNGLGYVFIVRLDEARADPKNLAGLQSAWIGVGIAAFIATLLVDPPGARPRALPLDDRLPRPRRCCCCPLVPGHRARVLRRPDLGEHRPGQLPARRVRQDPPGHLLRLLPGGEARAPRGEQPPPRADLRSPTRSTSARCCSPGRRRSS